MEFPKTILLWSADGGHAGFMLLAPAADGKSGDCVFMLTPVSAAGIESDMGNIVSELKLNGEHRFVAAPVKNGIDLTVCPVDFPELEFRFNMAFEGEVFTIMNGARVCVGSAGPMQGPA